MESNEEFKADVTKTDLLLGILKIESPSSNKKTSSSDRSIDDEELGKEEETGVNEEPNEEPHQDYSMTEDYAFRLRALEESDELRAIYSHPSWLEFSRVLFNGKNSAANAQNPVDFDLQMRQWAESHPQIAPVIAWFHQCTARFGFSFDPYVSVPQCCQATARSMGTPDLCTTTDGSDAEQDAACESVTVEERGAFDDVRMIPCGAEAAGYNAQQQQLHWQYMQQQHQHQAFLQQQQQAYNAFYFYQQQQQHFYSYPQQQSQQNGAPYSYN